MLCYQDIVDIAIDWQNVHWNEHFLEYCEKFNQSIMDRQMTSLFESYALEEKARKFNQYLYANHLEVYKKYTDGSFVIYFLDDKIKTT